MDGTGPIFWVFFSHGLNSILYYRFLHAKCLSCALFLVKCKSGWEFFHHTGKCYKRVDEILPMWAAREHCNFMEVKV